MLRSFKAGPYVSVMPNKGNLVIDSTPIEFGQGFQQEFVIWKFSTENPISQGNNLKITLTTNANFVVDTAGERCIFVPVLAGVP